MAIQVLQGKLIVQEADSPNPNDDGIEIGGIPISAEASAGYRQGRVIAAHLEDRDWVGKWVLYAEDAGEAGPFAGTDQPVRILSVTDVIAVHIR